MTKQDMRLRNRRVRKQAILLQKKVLSVINNRIYKPILQSIKKQDNIEDNVILNIVNNTFVSANIKERVSQLRFNRNKKDIKNYASNYLNELNKEYEKEKKRKINKG